MVHHALNSGHSIYKTSFKMVRDVTERRLLDMEQWESHTQVLPGSSTLSEFLQRHFPNPLLDIFRSPPVTFSEAFQWHFLIYFGETFWYLLMSCKLFARWVVSLLIIDAIYAIISKEWPRTRIAPFRNCVCLLFPNWRNERAVRRIFKSLELISIRSPISIIQ